MLIGFIWVRSQFFQELRNEASVSRLLSVFTSFETVSSSVTVVVRGVSRIPPPPPPHGRAYLDMRLLHMDST